MIKYPPDFAQKAKALYPDVHVLHKNIANGDPFVGSILELVNNNETILIKLCMDICDQLNPNQFPEIYQMADTQLKRQELFEAWRSLFKMYELEN